MNGYSTDQRKVLVSFFKQNIHETFSAKQLETVLGSDVISKSAIYRNIASMEKEGLLFRVASENTSEKLYRYVDHESCCGVIHLICEKCNTTHHLSKHVSEMISGLAVENFNFTVNKQKAVIYGLCDNCSQIQI